MSARARPRAGGVRRGVAMRPAGVRDQRRSLVIFRTVPVLFWVVWVAWVLWVVWVAWVVWVVRVVLLVLALALLS